MANLKAIKSRIGSIKNTQKITRAMKMVAAAKMRRAQERMFAARPYAGKIREMIHRLVANVDNPQSPLLEIRPVERAMIVVISGDRGLCGGFNANVLRRALQEYSQYPEGTAAFYIVGKKANDQFTKRGFPIVERHVNVLNDLDFALADRAAKYIMDAFVSGKVDEVKLVYNEFRNVATQVPVVMPLLPMAVEEEDEVKPTDFLYEPSQGELLKGLLPRYVVVQVWQALLESFAAEQAARMMAMDNATENATDLIKSLTLEYNKARQAAITTEILEIVAGAEALRNQ